MNQMNQMKNNGIAAIMFTALCFWFVSGCVSVRWTLKETPYGNETPQTMNIALPREQKAVHAIVYIHGGFYFSGSKWWYPVFLADFAENNIVASIDYRLLSGKENTITINEMLSDVHNALGRIQSIAEENGIVIKDFILAGHSSGAHLALLYAYKYLQENPSGGVKIAACVSLSGPTDYTDDFGWSSMPVYGPTLEQRLQTMSWIGTGLTGRAMELTRYDWTGQKNYAEYEPHIRSISPVTYVNGGGAIPPTLLVHGIDDRCVPYGNSIKLKAALDRYGVPNKLITPSGKGNNHMLGGRPNRTNAARPIRYGKAAWVAEAKEWISRYVQ
jgi:acetyl esterase/lipase